MSIVAIYCRYSIYRDIFKGTNSWKHSLCLMPQPVTIKCCILKYWCQISYPVSFNKGNSNNQEELSVEIFFLHYTQQ